MSRSVPDSAVLALGRRADAALALEDAGRDGRPAALEALRELERGYSGGDRPPSPPVSLLRAVSELEESLLNLPPEKP